MVRTSYVSLANQQHEIFSTDDVVAIVYQSENLFRLGAPSSARENIEGGPQSHEGLSN